MTNRAKSIPELPQLSALANNDLMVVVDVSSANITKKTTVLSVFESTKSFIFGPVPPSSIGQTGDSIGQMAIDSSYLYYCFASYDGVSNIWKRVALVSETW